LDGFLANELIGQKVSRVVLEGDPARRLWIMHIPSRRT
jgi:hypothetical protein